MITLTQKSLRVPFRALFIAYLLTLQIAVSAQGMDTGNDRVMPGGVIYVANQESDTITVVDGETFEVIATLAVEDRPHNVNHTADNRYALVTNKNINIDKAPSLSVIRVADNEIVSTINGIGSRIEHVIAPAADTAYVTEDLGQNAVIAIDIEERSIIESIKVGVKPHGLWPSPDGRHVFVPNQLSGTVSKIDTTTMRVVGEAAVGRTPTMVAVSPDGQLAYVSLYGERALGVLNASRVESGRMQINDVIPVGERPAQVAVTPDGRFILVACEGPGALYIVSADTHDVVGVIPTGNRAHGVDVSADSGYAFVTNWDDDSLSIVDIERMVVVRELRVGDEPAGVDFVPPPR